MSQCHMKMCTAEIYFCKHIAIFSTHKLCFVHFKSICVYLDVQIREDAGYTYETKVMVRLVVDANLSRIHVLHKWMI